VRWFVAVTLLAGVAWAADPKRPTDEQRGKELYERHCVACHGASAAGDGPATASLVVKVPDLQGAVKTDKESIELVRFGKGAMPAFEASFDNEDARRVLLHMSKVHEGGSKPAAPEPPTPAPAPEGDAQPADDEVPPEGPPG
jgi:mono/diheme cytochrome c family protein